MAAGKRHDTSEPLTEHDVAERFTHAMLRAWRIAVELENDPELSDAVKHSRYLDVGVLDGLLESLGKFRNGGSA